MRAKCIIFVGWLSGHCKELVHIGFTLTSGLDDEEISEFGDSSVSKFSYRAQASFFVWDGFDVLMVIFAQSSTLCLSPSQPATEREW